MITAVLDSPASSALAKRGARFHYRGEFTVIDQRHYKWIMERVAGHVSIGR